MTDSKEVLRLKERYGSEDVKRFGQYLYRVKSDRGFRLVYISEYGRLEEDILPQTNYSHLEILYLFDYKGYRIPEDEFYYKVLSDRGEGLMFASDYGVNLLLDPVYKSITKVRYACFKLETGNGISYVSTRGGVVKQVEKFSRR